jgi:outer membrane protein TolC
VKLLYKIGLIFCSILALSCQSFSADMVLDYTHIIDKSIQSSPQYKYIGYQLNSRQMNPAIKLGKLLPRIDIGANILHVHIIDIDTDGVYVQPGDFQSMDASVSLTQPLYDYGAYKDVQSAQETAQFAQQDYRTNYQQFLYDTSYAYFNLSKEIKNVDYRSFNRKVAKSNLNELQKKYDVGTANIADYETSKSNYYIAEADFAGAKRRKKVAEAQLHKFTNSNDTIELFDNDFELKDPSPASVDEWQQLAARSNPSYLGAMHTKESKYYDYQSSTSTFMPTVNFEVKYSPGVNSISQLGNPVFDNFIPAQGTVNAFYFGLSMEWNILSGGTDYAELKEAAYNYQASEFNVIQTGRIAKNDAMYAYRFVELKKAEIIQLRKSVASAKIAYEKYQEKYNQGTTTITQYFLLLNAYYAYLINLNDAEFEYIIGFLSLYKTAGILTTSTVHNFNDWVLFGNKIDL